MKILALLAYMAFAGFVISTCILPFNPPQAAVHAQHVQSQATQAAQVPMDEHVGKLFWFFVLLSPLLVMVFRGMRPRPREDWPSWVEDGAPSIDESADD